MKKIYIILSFSGTMPSRVIKLFTKYEYSHVSIALKKDIQIMYSFGRKKVNNPFKGGFIEEPKNGKFYKKFNKTKCTILEISITNKQYKNLIKLLKQYKEQVDIYKYDILGLILRGFNLKLNRKNHSVCTEFVASLLKESGIYTFKEKIIKPEYFMELPNKEIIYDGYLLNY